MIEKYRQDRKPHHSVPNWSPDRTNNFHIYSGLSGTPSPLKFVFSFEVSNFLSRDENQQDLHDLLNIMAIKNKE